MASVNHYVINTTDNGTVLDLLRGSDGVQGAVLDTDGMVHFMSHDPEKLQEKIIEILTGHGITDGAFWPGTGQPAGRLFPDHAGGEVDGF